MRRGCLSHTHTSHTLTCGFVPSTNSNSLPTHHQHASNLSSQAAAQSNTPETPPGNTHMKLCVPDKHLPPFTKQHNQRTCLIQGSLHNT